MHRFLTTITISLLIWITSTAGPTTVGCQYWFDDNYAERVNCETDDDIQINADCSSLENGLHYFNLRAIDSEGQWGPYYRYIFYYLDQDSFIPSWGKAQYWIDEDFEGRENVQLSKGNSFILDIDLENVPIGLHNLNLRLQDTSGSWNTLERYVFYAPGKGADNPTMSKVEYWMDEDSTNKTITPVTGTSFFLDIDLSSLKPGVHYLSMRIMDNQGQWGTVSRYIVNIPSEEDVFGDAPIIGYSYSFGNKEEYITVAPTKSLMLVDAEFDIPQLKDCYPIDDKCAFQFSENTISLVRKVQLPFGLKLKNSNGLWSSTTMQYIDAEEHLEHKTQELLLSHSITFDKSGIGDFGAFKIDMSEPGGYYIKTSEMADILLFNQDGTLYMSLKGEELVNAKQIPLHKATYYGVVYNMSTEQENTSTNITVRLMLTETEEKVPAPTISFDGEYVSMECEFEGAEIHYSYLWEDFCGNVGKDETIYTKPFTVDYNGTIKAYATHEGMATSDTVIYGIENLKAHTPAVQYHDYRLWMYDYCDGDVYYTMDGSDPRENGIKYDWEDQPFVKSPCVVKACVKGDGYKDSDVVTFVIDNSNFESLDPIFVPAYEDPHPDNIISIRTWPGYDIYYTLDGSEPTINSIKYTGPITLEYYCWVKAIAICEGYPDSNIVCFEAWWIAPKSPEFIYEDNYLTITSIYQPSLEQTRFTIIDDYTQENPYEDLLPMYQKGYEYTQPFLISRNMTVKAWVVNRRYDYSSISTITFDTFQVEAPVITFSNLQVSITSSTPGCDIYYTLDETDPATEGILYNGPFSLTESCIIQAIAKKKCFNDSEVTTFVLDVDNLKCPTPTYRLQNSSLYIDCAEHDAVIRYTLDGSEPTSTSTIYTGPIKLEHNCIVKSIAMKEGYINSPVVTYVVDWFQAGMPWFENDNGYLAIHCETFDKIYYTIGGDTPDESSMLYDGRIQLIDNRVVKARAYAENFLPSEIAVYNPDMFTCKEVEVDYDGRYATLSCATEGATIYYTTDGSNPTESSTQYREKFDVGGLCIIRAIAIKEFMNQSPVKREEILAYYDGETLQVVHGGCLGIGFGWRRMTEIEELKIIGPINHYDLQTLGYFTSLKHLDLTGATISGNSLPDRAFANIPLVSIQLPSTITKVGESIFEGCKELAAIKWNAYTQLPASAINGVDNPNLLLYVQVKSYAPTSIHNVVVDNVTETITLTDGQPGTNYNFYCPTEFKAKKISYIHSYTQQTIPNVCAGWEALSLPFEVTTIRHADKGEIVPFAAMDKNQTSSSDSSPKPFWLYELTQSGFVASGEIKAYTSYIISMPNNEVYADDYILSGEVTFSAENVMVPTTTENISHKGLVSFVPTTLAVGQSAEVYAINRYEVFEGKEEGSMFVSDLRTVEPFEGYWRIEGSGHKARALSIFDINDITGLIQESLPTLSTAGDNSIRIFTQGHTLYIESTKDQTVYIYSINGVLIKTVEVEEGVNVVEDLIPGFYIVNHQKVVIK